MVNREGKALAESDVGEAKGEGGEGLIEAFAEDKLLDGRREAINALIVVVTEFDVCEAAGDFGEGVVE